MKIIFIGTDAIALKTLDALLNHHEIVGIVTQPDRPVGRSKQPVPSPIALAGENINIPVFKPETIDQDLINRLKGLNADIFIVFAYGKILKKDFLSLTKFEGINIHPSLLPELRGPSPINTALLNGSPYSGLTIQTIAPKMDCGDIWYQEKFTILPDDDAISINKKVSELTALRINPVLLSIANGTIKPQPQDEQKATYCKLLQKEDGLINWNQKGQKIYNQIRALVDWPIAYTFLDHNRINIYKAVLNTQFSQDQYQSALPGQIISADKINGLTVKTADGCINLERIQQSGKKILNWKDFINGHKGLINKKFLME